MTTDASLVVTVTGVSATPRLNTRSTASAPRRAAQTLTERRSPTTLTPTGLAISIGVEPAGGAPRSSTSRVSFPARTVNVAAPSLVVSIASVVVVSPLRIVLAVADATVQFLHPAFQRLRLGADAQVVDATREALDPAGKFRVVEVAVLDRGIEVEDRGRNLHRQRRRRRHCGRRYPDLIPNAHDNRRDAVVAVIVRLVVCCPAATDVAIRRSDGTVGREDEHGRIRCCRRVRIATLTVCSDAARVTIVPAVGGFDSDRPDWLGRQRQRLTPHRADGENRHGLAMVELACAVATCGSGDRRATPFDPPECDRVHGKVTSADCPPSGNRQSLESALDSEAQRSRAAERTPSAG